MAERFEKIIESAEASAVRPELISGLFAEFDYFEPAALSDISRIKAAISTEAECALDRDLARLALAKVLVDSSNMIRRADLRRRRPNETNGQGHEVMSRFGDALRLMVDDLTEIPDSVGAIGTVQHDARAYPQVGEAIHDMCVTSPPYLNGTNYTRNTKLEMWILDLISTPDDMKGLRNQAVTAGINNVRGPKTASSVESRLLTQVLRKLDSVAYDGRLPGLIRGYFSDMSTVFEATSMQLRPGRPIYLDIGDSRFAGVHVPTDRILADVARSHGIELLDSTKIRDRRSKDGGC